MGRKMPYRLALDLGSTSLGWAVLRLDEEGHPKALMKAGVRIFSDGREPAAPGQVGASLAVHRREKRAMRRRRDRLLKRKERMMKALQKHGFFPSEAGALKVLETLNPYALRGRGLDQELTPYQFGRAIFHLNQRRGFKSNRKTDRGDSDSGALKKAIGSLRTNIVQSGCRSVGEWYWKVRMQEHEWGVPNQGVRARMPGMKSGKKDADLSNDFYVDRQMVAEEFDALWNAQASYHPEIYTEHAYKNLKEILFHQRKLRAVNPGRCTLLPEEQRAALALPSTQRFRILQEVNNLRVQLDARSDVELLIEQRNKIVALLESKTDVSFDKMREVLALPGTSRFNLEDDRRKGLKGNATTVALSKKGLFGAGWQKMDAALQDEIVLMILFEESENVLLQWLEERTGIDAERAYSIANTSLPEGYGNLSRKALERILPKLEAKVIPYSEAVLDAEFPHHSDLEYDFKHEPSEIHVLGERVIEATGEVKPVRVFNELPYYGRALTRHVAFGSFKEGDSEEKYFGKIANPTVHIGLNQIRIVVNALIRRYGWPAEVVIEVARELKQSHDQRERVRKEQTANQNRNKRIREEISRIFRDQGIHLEPAQVSRKDVEKWILWEELNPQDSLDRCCPYSGRKISAGMLLNGEAEVDHILPFAQTLDDSRNNRVVALRVANRIKGNATPWEAFGQNKHSGYDYDAIVARTQSMRAAKSYRFRPDGLQQWRNDDEGFLPRALNDTRHLSKLAVAYLSLVCPRKKVNAIPGQLTGMLRHHLGLDEVLGVKGSKNRNDHRHHAVDACVVGVIDSTLLMSFAKASELAHEEGRGRLAKDFQPPWETFFNHVQRAVAGIRVSHRPDHGYEGALMDETSYGVARDGRIKQRRKKDGGTGREVSDVIRITEPTQPVRHGIDAQGNPLPYKAYMKGGNYCIEITSNEKGEWSSRTLSTFEAYAIVSDLVRSGLTQKEAQNRLRHASNDQDGRPIVMRLVIGDPVLIEQDGVKLLLRVLKCSGTGDATFVLHNETNIPRRYTAKLAAQKLHKQGLPCDEVALNDVFFQKMISANSLKTFRARQVSISPLGDLRDPGFKE